jgi:AcrR family transcriptional regulator
LTKVRDRQQLIDVAARIFAERGFEAARLEDIAAELGVLKGSLYYHVSGKGELLYLVVLRILVPMIDSLEAVNATDAPAREKLAAAVRAHLRHFDEYYRESLMLFVERALPLLSREHRRDIFDRYRRYEALLHGLLQSGIEAGEFRADLDVNVLVLSLLGMCNWVPRWFRGDGRLTMDAIADVFLAVFLEGIGPRSRPASCDQPRPEPTQDAAGG